jgi:hypothetical protein
MPTPTRIQSLIRFEKWVKNLPKQTKLFLVEANEVLKTLARLLKTLINANVLLVSLLALPLVEFHDSLEMQRTGQKKVFVKKIVNLETIF